jgi:hypothetical protein
MKIFRYIRGEQEKTSRVVREVGNVTADTEITFEYGVRRDEKKQATTGTRQQVLLLHNNSK